eukprot:8342777-Prorocentrum_lima.AAC.1
MCFVPDCQAVTWEYHISGSQTTAICHQGVRHVLRGGDLVARHNHGRAMCHAADVQQKILTHIIPQ